MTKLTGQCLCGAVTIAATRINERMRACHCDMCRQQTSMAFASIDVDQETLEVSGPVTRFQSSDWAERAFCATCGSTLWYGTLHDGHRNMAAGLFENAGGATLSLEFFADQCPDGYALAGTHRKMTRDETIALFAPDEG